MQLFPAIVGKFGDWERCEREAGRKACLGKAWRRLSIYLFIYLSGCLSMSIDPLGGNTKNERIIEK